METETLHVYVLDNSDASCRSEDYNNSSRLLWQQEVVRTLSRAFLAPTRPSDDTQGLSNDSIALVSSGGKPLTRIPPTKDSASLLSLDLVCHSGEQCQFLPALRVALLAAKRSQAARVLAFLASEATLPTEQCSQLSRAFADARVRLDVVLLTQQGELPTAALESLQLLTAAAAYPSAPAAAAAATAAAGNRALGRPGAPRRPVGASAGPTPAHASSAAAASATPPGAVAAAPGGSSIGGGSSSSSSSLLGQRLIHFPPPDAALALWQQLEPLLEVLQPEVSRHEGGDADEAGDTDEIDQSGSGSGSTASGRPPLPRPPRARGAAAAGAPAALRSGVGAPTASRAGLPPSGPLPGRSGGLQRSGRAGLPSGPCRYESLDSLQHLSLDGFLRSWLPSYANVGKVLLQPQPGAASGSSTGTSATSSGGSASGSGAASAARGGEETQGGGSAGFGAAKLCYISVYRLQLPRWHKILEVHAGCCRELEAPDGEVPGQQAQGQGQGQGTAAKGAEAAAAPAADQAAGGVSDGAAPPRPVVARAPNPVQVSFSTRCSSAAAAATGDGGSPSPKTWVCPDARRGTLTMVASVENPGTVKLLWSERRAGGADGGGVDGAGGVREYGSIFEANEPGDVDVQVSSAELDLTLSPTKTEFRIVPHVSGGVVLEVRAPRNVVHRPPPAGAGSAAASSGCAAAGSSGGAADARPGSRDGKRFFFWLQQEFCPDQRYPPGDAATASSYFSSPPSGASSPSGTASPSVSTSGADASCASGSGSGSNSGDGQGDFRRSSGGGAAAITAAGAARSGGAGYPSWRGRIGGDAGEMGGLALARRLQDLMELPPEFDPHKHSNRVRCNTTPLQLGPLPLQLVEEIMRASGRELNADGTITTLAPGGGAGAGGAGGAAGGSGRSSVSAAASAMAGMMRSILVPRPPARSQGSAASQTAAAVRAHVTASTAAASGERKSSMGSNSPDEGQIYRHGHSHHHHIHPHLARSAAAGEQAAGSTAAGAVGSATMTPALATASQATPSPTAMTVPASAYATGVVGRAGMNAGGAAAVAAASAAAAAATAAASAAAAAAAAAMSSHPIDDLGSDWEEDQEDAEQPRITTRGVGAASEGAMAAAARTETAAKGAKMAGDLARAVPVAETGTADNQQSRRASGEERTACGFAAVASLPAAAAAAAAAASSASLVAAATVDAAADGSSSCAEDASLMFELD